MNSYPTSSELIPPPTVYLIDNQLQDRENISAVVSSQGWQCVALESVDQFHQLAQKNRPACLILSFRVEHEELLNTLESLHQRADAIPTLIIAAYADVPLAMEFIQRGAMTLLQQPCPQDELTHNIKLALVHDAQTYEQQQRMAEIQKKDEQLTERQQQIVDLMLLGHLNKRIAALIGVSQRTIENERAEILGLFQVNNAIQLATQITEYRGFMATKNKHQAAMN